MEVLERVIKLYDKGAFKGYRVVFGDIAYDIYRDLFDTFSTIEYICKTCLKIHIEKDNIVVNNFGYKTQEQLDGIFTKTVWDVTKDIKGVKLLNIKLKMCLNGELLTKEKEWRTSATLLHYLVDSVGYKKDIYVTRGSNGIKIKKMLDSTDYLEYVLTPKYVGSLLVGVELECVKEVLKGLHYPYVKLVNGSTVADNKDIYYKSDLRRCRLMRLNIRSNKHYVLKNSDKLEVVKNNIVYKHKISIKLFNSDKECISYLITNFNAS